MLPKIKNLLLKFDILGPTPELLHKNSPRFSTFIGLFLTISTILITGLSIKDIITNFTNNSNPSLHVFGDFTMDNSFELNHTSLKVFFQFNYYDLHNQSFNVINKTELTRLLTLYSDDRKYSQIVFPLFSILDFRKTSYTFLNITDPKGYSSHAKYFNSLKNNLILWC